MVDMDTEPVPGSLPQSAAGALNLVFLYRLSFHSCLWPENESVVLAEGLPIKIMKKRVKRLGGRWQVQYRPNPKNLSLSLATS
jgi:hypothetical protein